MKSPPQFSTRRHPLAAARTQTIRRRFVRPEPWLAALLLAVLPARVAADSRTLVTRSAAFNSSYGLEVEISPCSVGLDVTVGPPTVTGLVEACRTVAASNVEVVVPGATFHAGERIDLRDGFSVAESASFEAGISWPLSPYAWVEDPSPSSESAYQASFYLRLNALALAGGEDLEHLVGYNALGVRVFRVILRRNVAMGENRLALWAADEATPWGSEILLPNGWNRIEIDWSAGSGNGHLLASVNGGAFTGLTGLSNGSHRVEAIRWGSVGGNLLSTVGSLQLDRFRSTRIGGTQDVMLGWNANSEPDLAGYLLYRGTQSGVYDVIVDVGNTTSYTVEDLPVGQTYYFAVSAYDTGQNESGLSSELPVPIEELIFQDGFESGTTGNWAQ